MCGIAGYFGLKPDRAVLERMAAAQRHRGPDGQGQLLEGPTGLAHQRLAVIDRQGGRQPMVTPDGRHVLAYNGEVYNYRELRAELAADGQLFTTESDTEVVLRAYAVWGPAALARFNGMFALAVWDRHEQTLSLARDPFGIKPLHVSRIPDRFARHPDAPGGAWVFASEIAPILQSGVHDRAPDERTLYRYLRHRIHDDGNTTFFAGIGRVGPGELVTLSARGLESRSYSSLRDDLAAMEPDATGYGPDDVAALRGQLVESIALRLRSDVPVGTSLSGGLDSSTVAVEIDRLLQAHGRPAAAVGQRQRTFSAVFPGYTNDEERWVDDAVNACHGGLESHRVRPTSAELIADLAHFVRAQEEPVVSSGPYAQYRVMREASEHVTVMLDGQGADELIAGYLPQTVAHLRHLLGRDPKAAFCEAFASRDVLQDLVRSRLGARLRRRGSGSQAGAVLDPEFVAAHAADAYAIPPGDLRSRLLHDLFTASLPALLRYEDRNTMRFSVEGRVPFLDLNLVRAVFAMPDDAIIGAGWNKRALRDAVEGLVPDSIRLRRNKIGFTTPQNEWFHEQQDYVRGVFLSESFAGRPYFDQSAVLDAFEAWLEGKGALDSMTFWRLLNVELWLREFFDPEDADQRVTSQGGETDHPETRGSSGPLPAPADPKAAPGAAKGSHGQFAGMRRRPRPRPAEVRAGAAAPKTGGSA